MTRLLVYSGKAGAGASTCAAASAARIASTGTTTALVSIDRTGTLSDAFGVAVGPQPTRVRPDLTAVEINPEAGQETYEQTFERVAGVASVSGIDLRDGHVARLLESTHVPFGREVAALEAVASFVGDSDFDAVVFDTGLHGRFYRLLRMPGMLGIGVDVTSMAIDEVGERVDAATDRVWATTNRLVDPLTPPYGPSTPTGDARDEPARPTEGKRGEGQPADASTDEELLASRVGRVRSVLGGAGARELRVVTTPDRVAGGMTDHLVSNVEDAGIPVGPLVVNKVIEDGTCCARCAAIREEQQDQLDALRDRDDLELVVLPELHGEVAGEELLGRLGALLPEGAGQGGGGDDASGTDPAG